MIEQMLKAGAVWTVFYFSKFFTLLVFFNSFLALLIISDMHNKNEGEEGRILIINYSFLILEMNRSLRNPKYD